jgi:hypothetical protein
LRFRLPGSCDGNQPALTATLFFADFFLRLFQQFVYIAGSFFALLVKIFAVLVETFTFVNEVVNPRFYHLRRFLDRLGNFSGIGYVVIADGRYQNGEHHQYEFEKAFKDKVQDKYHDEKNSDRQNHRVSAEIAYDRIHDPFSFFPEFFVILSRIGY